MITKKGKKGKNEMKAEEIRSDLASDGVVDPDAGIAVRDELEIEDGDEAVVEDLNEMVDDEVGAIRTQGLVVEHQLHLVFSSTGTCHYKWTNQQYQQPGTGPGRSVLHSRLHRIRPKPPHKPHQTQVPCQVR